MNGWTIKMNVCMTECLDEVTNMKVAREVHNRNEEIIHFAWWTGIPTDSMNSNGFAINTVFINTHYRLIMTIRVRNHVHLHLWYVPEWATKTVKFQFLFFTKKLNYLRKPLTDWVEIWHRETNEEKPSNEPNPRIVALSEEEIWFFDD